MPLRDNNTTGRSSTTIIPATVTEEVTSSNLVTPTKNNGPSPAVMQGGAFAIQGMYPQFQRAAEVRFLALTV